MTSILFRTRVQQTCHFCVCTACLHYTNNLFKISGRPGSYAYKLGYSLWFKDDLQEVKYLSLHLQLKSSYFKASDVCDLRRNYVVGNAQSASIADSTAYISTAVEQTVQSVVMDPLNGKPGESSDTGMYCHCYQKFNLAQKPVLQQAGRALCAILGVKGLMISVLRH